MNQQQLILTKLLGKKELSFGCTIKCKYIFWELYYARLAWAIPKDGWCGYDYIDEHGNRLNTKQFEIIWHPATLSDFHRWMNKHFKEDWMQDEKEIGYVLKLKEYFDYDLNTQMIALKPTIAIYYDSSKDLLEQSPETLAQIIELITNNS